MIFEENNSFYPNSSNPAHSVGVIKDKMCILKMQDTLLFSSISKKRQGSQ